MSWLLWGLGAYAALSVLIGLFAAAVAWDYNPWEAFWLTALSWPVLVVAFIFG
jgi:hypothetical protein